jgi:hypothetical protein
MHFFIFHESYRSICIWLALKEHVPHTSYSVEACLPYQPQSLPVELAVPLYKHFLFLFLSACVWVPIALITHWSLPLAALVATMVVNLVVSQVLTMVLLCVSYLFILISDFLASQLTKFLFSALLKCSSQTCCHFQIYCCFW